MEELEISKEILTYFTGTLLALLSAGVVWFLKSAYEKHKSEILALAKFERILANNITILKDNFDFIDEWISFLNQNRPYSVYFEKYHTNEEETYKLSNLDLINQILSINHKLRRTSLDLDNIYKSYWDIISQIDSIQDETRRKNNLEIYNDNVQKNLKQIKQNYEPLKNNLINTIALVRATHRVRFHSLFGYMSLMFIDIFPRVTKKNIEKEVIVLKDNIEKKKVQNNYDKN